MINYDKQEIRETLTIEDIFDLLLEWGGEPIYQSEDIIISRTICHNHPNGDASHKLYYYQANNMFHCYSGCSNATFDIFELTQKVFLIQQEKEIDLNEAVRWIAYHFGLSGSIIDDKYGLADKKILDRYSSIEELQPIEKVELKEYDSNILKCFNYNLILRPWLNEGITQEVLNIANIGYFVGRDQITIPHYDFNNRLVGIRGRTMCKEEGELYGKYRPLKIMGQLYNHPLGLNLYTIPGTVENIALIKKAIIVESEKSVLKYASMFGIENNICVAICGSNLSAHQVQMLLDLGVNEIIIALDRQYKELGDEECKLWVKKLKKINSNYSSEVLISYVFDKENILSYKSSPVDEGKDKFLYLFKKRFVL